MDNTNTPSDDAKSDDLNSNKQPVKLTEFTTSESKDPLTKLIEFENNNGYIVLIKDANSVQLVVDVYNLEKGKYTVAIVDNHDNGVLVGEGNVSMKYGQLIDDVTFTPSNSHKLRLWTVHPTRLFEKGEPMKLVIKNSNGKEIINEELMIKEE
ncbi:hypothetical protein [Cytobacillus sp. IB215316]|uniref:hypothetical protein n=1 Tax=Cytobacillus sp. IB215316 TaxID=3097354 RepID=UPI002A17249A|nr:hypothetical protein [Cytobacillus sp. IB215316]MDX8360715.1 hypothetical protein [Cytobacillus sp. IB215316]